MFRVGLLEQRPGDVGNRPVSLASRLFFSLLGHDPVDVLLVSRLPRRRHIFVRRVLRCPNGVIDVLNVMNIERCVFQCSTVFLGSQNDVNPLPTVVFHGYRVGVSRPVVG